MFSVACSLDLCHWRFINAMEILSSRCLGCAVIFRSQSAGSCRSWLSKFTVRNCSSLKSTNCVTGVSSVDKKENKKKSTMDKAASKKLVESLSPDDRQSLLTELHRVRSEEAIAEFTVAMARHRWRRRFSGVSEGSGSMDPSGRFCEIPSIWIRSQGDVAQKPSFSSLLHYSVYCGFPFIGFGFLDNVIMITAGDYIEMSMGAALGIGTMTAAALGNAVSDVAGIGSAFYIEMLALKIGIRPPDLSPAQLELKVSHWSANIGRTICLTLGCILGMFPLLFLPDHSKDSKNSEKTTKTAPADTGS